MENNKKLEWLFVLGIVVIFSVAIYLIKDINQKRDDDLQQYEVTVKGVLQGQNNVIKTLAVELKSKQNKYNELQETLIETRNNLDALSKKLTETSTPPVAVAAPAPVAASASAPVAASK